VRPIKIVSIVDEHTRECLGGLVERCITGELDHPAQLRGYPAVLRCDNGPELACAAMAGDRVVLHFIPPGQPWRNGHIESFNSRIRDVCLGAGVMAHSLVLCSTVGSAAVSLCAAPARGESCGGPSSHRVRAELIGGDVRSERDVSIARAPS